MEHGSVKIGAIFDFGLFHLEWPTALFVFVVFAFTMFVLNTLLFRPILRTLETRQSNIDRDKQETQKLSSTIATSEQNYQSRLSDLKEKIQQTRQEALDDAMEKAKQAIGQTRESIEKKLETAEKELSQERNSAMKEASSMVEGLAQLISKKVLA